MLAIRPITNVNNTPNRNNISFKSGVQTNYGLQAPSPKANIVEGGFIPGFVGTVAPTLNRLHDRANSIEKGLNETGSKLKFFA